MDGPTEQCSTRKEAGGGNTTDERRVDVTDSSLQQHQQQQEKSETSLCEKDDNAELLQWTESNDCRNPVNWTESRKWLVTGVTLIGTFLLPLNGTCMTVAVDQINNEFGVSDTFFPNSYWAVTSWSVGGGIFIIIFLPLMEDVGVRFSYYIFYAFFCIMLVPQALARNYATLVITRFFSGGCVALLSNTVSSMIADLWETDEERSFPVGVYIVLYLTGSTLAPVVFAPVVQFLGDWRWIFYIQLIVYVALAPIFFMVIRETRGDVILRRHAKSLRKQDKKPVYAEAELNDDVPIHRRLYRSATRPLYLLATEPVLLASTMWSAFSFGTVFLFTQSTAQVFITLYDWEQYQVGYVQAAIVVGELLGWLVTFYGTRLYLRSASRNDENPGRPIPEARLYVSIPASFVGLTGGMFVYAWTSYSSLPWIAPVIGLAMVGFGIQVVVAAVADYITDAYAASAYAGSAISAVAFGENIVAGFLPLAAQSMYTGLGLQWASTLLGLIAVMLSFAPIMFVWKGRWFRSKSPFMQSGGFRPARKVLSF